MCDTRITIIAAVDADSNLFACGHLISDGFGLFIRVVIGTGEHKVPIDRVRLYALMPLPLI